MRNRIVSFLLVCVFVIVPLVSGCSPKEEPDKSTGKAVREKITNVFKTNWMSLPDDYSLAYNISPVSSNNRIYLLVYREIDETAQRRSVIVSYDNDGGDMRLEETPYENITNFTVLSDGSKILVLSVYDSLTQTNEYWITKIDATGNEVFSVNVASMIPQASTVEKIAVDGQERIYLKMSPYVVVVSPDSGEKLFHVSVPSESRVQVIKDILPVGGKMAVLYYESSLVFKYIDTDERKMGDSVYTPKDLDIRIHPIYPVCDENDSETLYYYKTDTGLYSVSVNESDEKSTEVINWINSDISTGYSTELIVISSDRIFYKANDSFTYDIVMAALKRIPDDEVVPKYVIEVAYVSSFAPNELISLAMKFNQQSDDYRVKFTDYRQLSGNLDGDDLTVFINMQLAAGNIPDMFLFDNNMSGKNYEDKGLFCDLYEYMDNDSELGRDKFLRCMLPTGEVDGKLYYIPDSFSVFTVVGKTENTGNVRGWSISDFLNLAENLDDGIYISSYASRSGVYSALIRSGLGEFIDYESGTCSFDSDVFMRLLRYLENLPLNSPNDYIGGEENQRAYRENATILMNSGISNFIEYMRFAVDFGTEDLTVTGYPGGGDKINLRSSYAISAQSEKEIRDGAWAFIKYVMLNSVNNPKVMVGGKSFPSTYESFYRFAETEMRRYYLVEPSGMSTSIDEFSPEQMTKGVPMRVTQDDVDKVLAYLESIEAKPAIDTKVLGIINEEMEYFLAGAKTAQETTRLIQSRVSIYLSESQ